MLDEVPPPVAAAVTAIAIVAAALLLRRHLSAPKRLLPPPGRLERVATILITPDDLGRPAEAMRDFARTVGGGAVKLLDMGADGSISTRVLDAPVGLQGMNEGAAADACKSALEAALKTGDGVDVTAVGLLRLVTMLSVGAAFAVVSKADAMASLQSPSFLIARTPDALRAVIVGFIGATPQNPKPMWFLTILSPNLLAPAQPELSLSGSPGLYAPEYRVEYHTSPRLHAASTIDQEIQRISPDWVLGKDDVTAL